MPEMRRRQDSKLHTLPVRVAAYSLDSRWRPIAEKVVVRLLSGKMLGGPTVRIVTHLDVTSRDIDTVIATIREFFSAGA